MSINKAVAYLLLGALLSILLGVFLMRVKTGKGPDRKQALGEIIYEIARVQVAEQGLPAKAMRTLVPLLREPDDLHLGRQHARVHPAAALRREGRHRRGAGPDARDLRRDLDALGHAGARPHDLGLHPRRGDPRERCPARTCRSWIPDVPKALYPLIIPLEILGQFMRLISLSVRLYANMLAGHMLILTFIGLIFVLGNLVVAVVAVPAAIAFYLFEVVIVVSIQAYIFAALSAIYIGSAIEPEH